MEYGSKNLRDLPEAEQGLSPELNELLRSTHPAPEIMPWDRVVALVESAPPVRVPWYVAFLDSYQRQLRYAAAPLMVMLLIGVMWAMPAQSLNIGTTVVSELPQDWSSDSPQVAELNAASRAMFADMALPQSSLRLMVMPQDGAQKMVMVLSGADAEQAQSFYNQLSGDFPVLAAMQHELHPIETRMHENLLRDVASRISGTREVEGLSDNQLSLLVMDILTEAGFSNIRLDIQRTSDGKVRINVEADLDESGSTSELSLDELREAGYEESTLGNDAYKTLYEEMIGVDSP